jgi:hypothetical protein
MKLLLPLGFLFFSLSFCNLANKFIGGKTDTPADSNVTKTDSPTSKTDEITAEKYSLTPEQSGILNSGKDMKWDEQGIGWTLPTGWKKTSSSPTTLVWSSSNGAFLIANVSPLGGDFPTDISLKANYDGSVTRQKNGELEKLRYVEIDGLKGIEFIEVMPNQKDDPRRHQWISFRKYAGQVQMLNFMLTTKGASFDKHRDEFAAIISSTKITR